MPEIRPKPISAVGLLRLRARGEAEGAVAARAAAAAAATGAGATGGVGALSAAGCCGAMASAVVGGAAMGLDPSGDGDWPTTIMSEASGMQAGSGLLGLRARVGCRSRLSRSG